MQGTIQCGRKLWLWRSDCLNAKQVRAE